MPSLAPELFRFCVEAIDKGVRIVRVSSSDKEFALQNWVKARLEELGVAFSESGRNTFPDFPLTDGSEGFEVKGLFTHNAKGKPNRLHDYDSNSHVPTGRYHGRTIYCVFGRYPQSGTNEHSVYDLVICHGDFLNPPSDYEHRNTNIPTFGGYSDIMIRDRKMYVVPTPYGLADGLVGQRTLIMPAGEPAPDGLVKVSELTRVEAAKKTVGYRFDLRTNKMTILQVDNPTAGQPHIFACYRMPGEEQPPVALNERRRQKRG